MEGFNKGYEYPLLMLLGDEDGTRNVFDVEVNNPSKVYAVSTTAPPCVIICPDCVEDMPDWASYKARFSSTKVLNGVAVLTAGKQVETGDGCSAYLKPAGMERKRAAWSGGGGPRNW